MSVWKSLECMSPTDYFKYRCKYDEYDKEISEIIQEVKGWIQDNQIKQRCRNTSINISYLILRGHMVGMLKDLLNSINKYQEDINILKCVEIGLLQIKEFKHVGVDYEEVREEEVREEVISSFFRKIKELNSSIYELLVWDDNKFWDKPFWERFWKMADWRRQEEVREEIRE